MSAAETTRRTGVGGALSRAASIWSATVPQGAQSLTSVGVIVCPPNRSADAVYRYMCRQRWREPCLLSALRTRCLDSCVPCSIPKFNVLLAARELSESQRSCLTSCLLEHTYAKSSSRIFPSKGTYTSAMIVSVAGL